MSHTIKVKNNTKEGYYIHLFFLILILIQFAFVYLSDLEMNKSQIHLIVEGTGDQRLLSDAFNGSTSFRGIPSEVLINGIRNISCNKMCYLPEERNNVTLRFSYQIDSFDSMFDSYKTTLINIIEVDFSEFDASKVTSMFRMFRS